MWKPFTRVALMDTLAVAGCANRAQFLDGKQAMAMQTAVSEKA